MKASYLVFLHRVVMINIADVSEIHATYETPATLPTTTLRNNIRT